MTTTLPPLAEAGSSAIPLAITVLPSVAAALAHRAAQPVAQSVTVALLRVPAPGGLAPLLTLQAEAPELPVVVLVDQVDQGLGAVRAGAQDFVLRQDVEGPGLGRVVACALERHRRQLYQAAGPGVEAQLDLAALEARLRHSQSLLRVASHVSRLGAWWVDLPEQTMCWSEEMYRILDWPADDEPRLGEVAQYFIPADRGKIGAAFERCRRTGVGFDLELQVVTAAGRSLWVRSIGEAVRDSCDRIVRVQGACQDISAQKLAEQRLRESDERFRLLSKATNDAIWDWNIVSDSTWRGEGYKALFGYDNGDLETNNDWWRDRLHPDDCLRLLASIERALAAGATSWMEEYRFRCKDGRYATVLDRGYVIRSATGEPLRMIGGMVNVTEKKTLEAQLMQSQKMEAMGQLTGGVAHDFNNLLTVILGNAELLAEQLAPQPGLRSLAAMISAAAQRGADLTQRLLVFARRQTLSPKPVDVNGLMARLDGLLRRTLGEQIEICYRCDQRLGAALVDASQLEGALLNLCLNARDAMAEGGCLTLATAPVSLSPAAALPGAGDYVMVAVTDTGMGMGEDLLGQVFEPFFTTKPEGKGTGLGLSMVYGFVKQSNGHIHIESAVGVGTTVRLYLPRCDRTPETAATAPSPVVGEGGAEVVLLVEDDELVRRYAQHQLESLGYRVLVADSGPTALDLVRQRPDIDLLFTDVLMPGGLNGRPLAEAAQRLRPGLRVLYTSGHADHTLIDQGHLEAGVPLLPKPYQRSDLARQIRQALGDG
ncbi:MAG TPA: PAS domain-containing protein [Nodosilinea sp.]|nr:PAS domain-containing protein [Nodosilinea sp.]